MTTTGGVPPQILGEWRSAEERLYPVVMLRPDLYQRSVELVRRVADELATCGTVGALVEAWPQAIDIVYRASALALLPLGDLDVALVAGSAFSLRYRELAAVAAREERVDRVRQAAAEGRAWVELERSGSPETAAFLPHTRLEMHVPTGLALRHSLEADPDTGSARYRLETLRLDRHTGEVLGASEAPSAETFATKQEWEAAIDARRLEIESGS